MTRPEDITVQIRLNPRNLQRREAWSGGERIAYFYVSGSKIYDAGGRVLESGLGNLLTADKDASMVRAAQRLLWRALPEVKARQERDSRAALRANLIDAVAQLERQIILLREKAIPEARAKLRDVEADMAARGELP